MSAARLGVAGGQRAHGPRAEAGTRQCEGRLAKDVTIKIGVILPTSTPDPAQPIMGDVRASARLAEELGLDSVWSTDHLVASAPILDSSVVLATAAAVTDRITIGYGVMILALRPAAWAAKQISTLQYVSGNRVVLGVGTGNPRTETSDGAPRACRMQTAAAAPTRCSRCCRRLSPARRPSFATAWK